MKNMEITLENNVPGIGIAGQRVTLDVTPGEVREASEMSDYLAGYRPYQFRADEASPIVLRDHRTDKFRTFSADDAFLKVSVKGDARGNVNEIDASSSTSDYVCVARFIGSFVARASEQEAVYDMRMAAARRIRNALDLDREIDVWALMGTYTNWDASVRVALTTNQNWNGGSASTPITNLQTMLKASAQPITDIFMNRTVAEALLTNTQTVAWMSSMLGSRGAENIFNGAVGGQNFQLPTMPPIHIVESKYSSTTGGSRSDCLGNVVIGISKPPGIAGMPTSGEEVASSYTFRKRGDSGNGYQAREVMMEMRGLEGGTMIIGGTEDVPKMTSTIAGGIIYGTVIA